MSAPARLLRAEDVCNPAFESRFWKSVDKAGPTPVHCAERGPCWLWTGKLDKRGYGITYSNRLSTRAHRAAWTLAKGEIEGGLHVCHHCDNRRCVNPGHMFLGTVGDNTRDMLAKGRAGVGCCSASGERNFKARLTVDDVVAVRLAYGSTDESVDSIASRYGIHRHHIYCIAIGRYWKHVPGAVSPRPWSLDRRDQRGEHNPRARLSAAQVAEIRLAVAAGEPKASIRGRFGISNTHITRIAKLERWAPGPMQTDVVQEAAR